jgi:hypothetical protein
MTVVYMSIAMAIVEKDTAMVIATKLKAIAVMGMTTMAMVIEPNDVNVMLDHDNCCHKFNDDHHGQLS